MSAPPGLIAMKLDEGDHLIGVATCREGDDVLLATRKGRCIRFQLSDDQVRVFAGRDSSGVRGIKLLNGDEVISLSVLRHVQASPEERIAYLRQANAKRRGNGEAEAEAPAEPDGEDDVPEVTLSPERFAEMEATEEMLLTVTDMGFGKRTSAYEYRVTGRGGQGIGNITLAPRNGKTVVATFPVRQGDDIMMVTDAGRLIRVPVDQVRTTGRQAMGVTLFRVDKGEHVTSVFTVLEDEAEENGGPEAGAPEGPVDPDGASDGSPDNETPTPEEGQRWLIRLPIIRQRIGLYPGTFDPVTNGHLDVIARAARLLDKLVVGVAINTGKGPLFTLDERVELVRAEIATIATRNGMVIEVVPFDTLLIDFARKLGASMIVRGLRAVSDFDNEFQMAGMNYRMAPDIETVFLMASETHQFIASRLVKEVAMLGGDITSFVPPLTLERVMKRVRG